MKKWNRFRRIFRENRREKLEAVKLCFDCEIFVGFVALSCIFLIGRKGTELGTRLNWRFVETRKG